jgi:succinate dehydrogenase/fumarate reductase flavoprotein subunit
VSLVPYRSGRSGTFPHIMDRAKPGSIGVLRSGKRFVNEANGYYDYVAAMLEATPAGEQTEAWQIADSRFVRRFPLGMAKPLPVPLFPYLRSGYLKKGGTLEELAERCGIDPAGLKETWSGSTAMPPSAQTRTSAGAPRPSTATAETHR